MKSILTILSILALILIVHTLAEDISFDALTSEHILTRAKRYYRLGGWGGYGGGWGYRPWGFWRPWGMWGWGR